MTQNPNPETYVAAIKASGLSIYDEIPIGHPTLWIPTPQLEQLLQEGLQGISLAGLPLRTRSKVVKESVCRVLGYPIPKSFKKTQPRFPGQFFDTYTQKSNNLQIWNEELSPSRRYVIIRVSDADEITRVKVVTGDTLAILDTTGTLTQKYQARCIVGEQQAVVGVARRVHHVAGDVLRHCPRRVEQRGVARAAVGDEDGANGLAGVPHRAIEIPDLAPRVVLGADGAEVADDGVVEGVLERIRRRLDTGDVGEPVGAVGDDLARAVGDDGHRRSRWNDSDSGDGNGKEVRRQLGGPGRALVCGMGCALAPG